MMNLSFASAWFGNKFHWINVIIVCYSNYDFVSWIFLLAKE